MTEEDFQKIMAEQEFQAELARRIHRAIPSLEQSIADRVGHFCEASRKMGMGERSGGEYYVGAQWAMKHVLGLLGVKLKTNGELV